MTTVPSWSGHILRNGKEKKLIIVHFFASVVQTYKKCWNCRPCARVFDSQRRCIDNRTFWNVPGISRMFEAETNMRATRFIALTIEVSHIMFFVAHHAKKSIGDIR